MRGKAASSRGTVFSAAAWLMPKLLPKIGVGIAPGQTQFTRTPPSASSMAAHWVRWAMAALAAL
jgi:hypothetical protein